MKILIKGNLPIRQSEDDMQNFVNKWQAVIIAAIGLIFQVVVLYIPDIKEADFTQFVFLGFLVLAGLTKVEDFFVQLAVRFEFDDIVEAVIEVLRDKGINISEFSEDVAKSIAKSIDKQLEADVLAKPDVTPVADIKAAG